jgi:hypothetical protein
MTYLSLTTSLSLKIAIRHLSNITLLKAPSPIQKLKEFKKLCSTKRKISSRIASSAWILTSNLSLSADCVFGLSF